MSTINKNVNTTHTIRWILCRHKDSLHVKPVTQPVKQRHDLSFVS